MHMDVRWLDQQRDPHDRWSQSSEKVRRRAIHAAARAAEPKPSAADPGRAGTPEHEVGVQYRPRQSSARWDEGTGPGTDAEAFPAAKVPARISAATAPTRAPAPPIHRPLDRARKS